MSIDSTIDAIFEDTKSYIGVARDVSHKVDQTQQLLADLRHRLSTLEYKIAGELAFNIRKRRPSLNVSLNKDGCKVGYKSNSLTIRPDINHGVWNIKSKNRSFVKKFIGTHKQHIIIKSNSNQIVNAIIKHFNDYYKSLGEDIEGNGVVLIEGYKKTLSDLVKIVK